MTFTPKILIFSPATGGGVAEYTFYQVNALRHAGANVVCLVAPGFLAGRPTEFEKIICLPAPISTGSPGLLRKIKTAWQVIHCRIGLVLQIFKHKPDLVLLDSYLEYLSPLWVWPHWLLSWLGLVKYAANLHDPVRNYIVGPKWWHRLSVRLAYQPLNFVLVHDSLPAPSPVPRGIKVVEVPHGLYEISGPAPVPAQARHEWGVPQGQRVFLSFGFVRDGKNLDLAIRALAHVKDVVLVVAGSVASAKDKDFSFYRRLAREMGVSDRCRFFEGFVADHDLAKYFAGADFVLLTYASSFHSQSGVLNLAARARKPVLASAAPGPLTQSVAAFSLGAVVPPDSVEAIASGMHQLLLQPPQPRWDDYENTFAWAVNARGVMQAAGWKAA